MATRSDIDPWAAEDSRSDLGYSRPASRAVALQSPASSPKPMARIDPAINERVAMLASRFPKGGDEGEEFARLRLLAQDLTETMDVAAVDAAISEGRKTWRFLPTLAEIIEAAQPFLAERRAKMKSDRERREAEEAKRLAPPVYVDAADTDAMLKALYAKIDAGSRQLMGLAPGADWVAPADRQALPTPEHSDLSPRMIAMRDHLNNGGDLLDLTHIKTRGRA